MAGALQVEPGSLTADALDLADAQVPIVPPMAVPPAADPVSQGVAAVFEAHSGALTMVVEHSGALRAHDGAALARTAATLQGADDHNGATFAALAGGTAPAAAPSMAALPAPAAPPQVRLPEIPALTPPPTLPGDQLAALIHGGPGSSGLRNFADAWRAHADTLDGLADHVLSRGAGIDEHWIDGAQRAGANTREHGYWLRASADQARTIAAGAAQVAEQFDTAKTATPSPEQFDDARREFTAAQARRDPTGMAMAARQYAQMQAQASTPRWPTTAAPPAPPTPWARRYRPRRPSPAAAPPSSRSMSLNLALTESTATPSRVSRRTCPRQSCRTPHSCHTSVPMERSKALSAAEAAGKPAGSRLRLLVSAAAQWTSPAERTLLRRLMGHHSAGTLLTKCKAMVFL